MNCDSEVKVVATRKATLTMEQRVKILHELESGSPVRAIAARYNVRQLTIRRIRASAPAIRQFMDQGNQFKKWKSMRKPTHEKLEGRLYSWFLEQKTLGYPLTDLILLEKAAELNEELSAGSTFKTSRGWLAKFKRRHNIRLMNINREIAEEDENRFSLEGNRFCPEENRFNLEANRFSLETNRFNLEENRFGLEENRFSLDENRFNLAVNRFNPEENKFNPEGNRFSSEENRFSSDENRYSPDENRYSPEENRFSPKEKKFNPEENTFYLEENKFNSEEDRLSPKENKFNPQEVKRDQETEGEEEQEDRRQQGNQRDEDENRRERIRKALEILETNTITEPLFVHSFLKGLKQ
ncbi:golgin subfamily A member 6-like protein 7, partial [Colletes gigas]|uniref:golgin subfamily A member 6-like protein 7 n=1 Tax=Colletes gigas TaxID=935657 RepID=UPI001C9B98E7